MFLYDDLCRLFHFLQFQFSLTSSPLHRIDLPLQFVFLMAGSTVQIYQGN